MQDQFGSSSTARRLHTSKCDPEYYTGLQPRATDDPVALGGNVVAGDMVQRRAAAQRHGGLELVPQHLQHVPHASLAVHS
uniref:Hao1 n=1 Tax=Arundo donax TaxID=35708 RepID=A0A0A9FUN2_ARUDO